MSDELPPLPSLEPGVYKHYKGKKYEVLGVGLHSETEEPVVVYRPLYETKVSFWVRPYDMFVGSVETGNQTTPRFKRIVEKISI